MVLRDVIHDNYIQRPEERSKQVRKEGVFARLVSYLGNSSILERTYCMVAIPQ